MPKAKTPDILTVICKACADCMSFMSGNHDDNIIVSCNLVPENSVGPKEIGANASLLVKTAILIGKYCVSPVIRLPDCIIDGAVKQAYSEEEPESKHGREFKIKALFTGFHVQNIILHAHL